VSSEWSHGSHHLLDVVERHPQDVPVNGDRGEMHVINPPAAVVASDDREERRNQAPRAVPAPTDTTSTNSTPSARRVLRGEPTLTPPADSIANMRVLDAIYVAAGMTPRGT